MNKQEVEFSLSLHKLLKNLTLSSEKSFDPKENVESLMINLEETDEYFHKLVFYIWIFVEFKINKLFSYTIFFVSRI